MALHIEDRPSDSPFVERVWRSRSENIDTFVSVAGFQWDLVFWTQEGRTQVAIQGPETHASRAPVPEDAEFFGILFKPGVFMPHLPGEMLVDNNLPLPDAVGHNFWLNSSVWQMPNYENAETFVDRLVRQGVINHEPAVDAVLKGHEPHLSQRSVQRRFLYTTGLNYRTIQQIERARRAVLMLREGSSILDTTYELGYFDQAYLTKSLKHFIGQTPSQLMDERRAEQLSLLYKTDASVLT